MKIYKVTYKNYSSLESKTVSASTIEKAIDDFKRWSKKNMYGSKEILVIDKIMEIDISYKS